MKNLNLKGGVLIIGSLWWDPAREGWRRQCLNIEEVKDVALPIRYGRLSGADRRYTHTMIFSSECKKSLGMGLVVGLNERIASFEQLDWQVRALMEAEMKRPPEIDRYNWGWGMVTLSVNPKHLSEKSGSYSECQSLLAYWHSKIGQGLNVNDYKVGGEAPIVDKNGILLIDWQDSLSEYDFVVAMATKPGLAFYPSASDIGRQMACNAYPDYLLSNIQHGITTFQDNEILEGRRQGIDIPNFLAKSSLPLVVVKPSRNEPMGFGSGCLVRYKGRQFLLTVSHVSNIRDGALCIMTYLKGDEGQSKLYSVGATWYFDQYKLPKTGVPPDLLSIEHLDKYFDETVDFTFGEVKEHIEMIQPEWRFPDYTVYKGPRMILELEHAGPPEKGKEYGFAGSIRQDLQADSLQVTPTVKMGLSYGRRIGWLEYFVSPELITDADDYRGCSGAPILDEEGKLVALAAQVIQGSKVVYGFSIEECRRLIDVTLLDEAGKLKE